MKHLNAMLAVMAIASLICIGMPSAHAQAIDCQSPVIDNSTVGLFDQSQVTAAIERLHAVTDNNLEVYVRGEDKFTTQNPTVAYDQRLRDACNPATDYILIALDDGAYANTYYGSHFDRLTPVLNELTQRFMSSFYAASSDKTAAVVELLNALTTTFEQNPGYADYVVYPNGFVPVGPTSSNDKSPHHGGLYDLTPFATPVGLVTLLGLVAVAIGVTALVRDKRDHSHR